jgi:hypothetical protein
MTPAAIANMDRLWERMQRSTSYEELLTLIAAWN